MSTMTTPRPSLRWLLIATLWIGCSAAGLRTATAELRAGAAIVDVTPQRFPVLVNGGMLSRSVDKVNTPVHARAVAVANGNETVVMVVVDSCMMPRDLLDEVKARAAAATGVAANHIMISATHTHTAPSCLACLGTDADPNYVPYLQVKLVEAIQGAVEKLEPAEVGFAKTDASEFTALRRWIRRPDRIANDPFGNPTVRANMHAARNPDDVTGESGPEDPDLSVIAFRTREGRPIALLANFSMHYFGDRDISADYFGRFCNLLQERIAPKSGFVAIMSHGCSGDIWRRDYSQPKEKWDPYPSIDQYAEALAKRAYEAYQTIEYSSVGDVAMVERRLKMKYRVPDKQRLEWAQRIVKEMGDRPPKSQQEVYAREQIILHERQGTTVVVQAIRIGDIAIATTPNETYALSGLKIKAMSPIEKTVVIELANGGDGYIPPPEQHLLGGYNTWPARSAGLEVTAEPRIVEACLESLEHVSGQPRRLPKTTRGPAGHAIARLKPLAWYRLDEFAGPCAQDETTNSLDAVYEPGVVFYLAGPRSSEFCSSGELNRAAMFAGGRLQTRLPQLKKRYTVSFWIWNGMPNEGRPITGWLYSRGHNFGLADYSEHLGIGGRDGHAGKLVLQQGADGRQRVAGKTVIPRWSWHHVALVRDGERVKAYLDGELEIDTRLAADWPENLSTFFFGGRCDNESNFEGRLDEVSVFQRPLDSADIRRLSAKAP